MNKGQLIDMTEKYHIYRANKEGTQQNDTHTCNIYPIYLKLYITVTSK